MDPIWIAAAFALGWLVRQIGLPPMVGYLGAGFVLGAFGFQGGPIVDEAADLGIWLLLFSIGLKLELRQLVRPEVLVPATVHFGISVGLGMALLIGLGGLGLPLVADLDQRGALLVAFGLAFSSTVLAVKVLERRRETAALHGRVAIGILIIQDVIAVLFLAFSKGALPSVWALALIPGLLLARPLLYRLFDRSGHGELLTLLGLSLAVGAGATAFEAVGLKADLGALILGLLMGRHPRAEELGNALLQLKNLFLLGFFLQIGLSGAPDLTTVAVGVALAGLAPVKAALFFVLLTRLRLRARTSLLASLSLGSTSEFGLLVMALATAQGWVPVEWVVVMSVSVAVTFAIASPFVSVAPRLYRRLRGKLQWFETRARLEEERPTDFGDADILICGMGMVGTGAYDELRRRHGRRVLGLDFDVSIVEERRRCGRDVVRGDATDGDFWERVDASRISLIMLCIPSHDENLEAVARLSEQRYGGLLAATALYDDQVEQLREAGVTEAYNFYSEAGRGFADHVCTVLAEDLGCAPGRPRER